MWLLSIKPTKFKVILATLCTALIFATLITIKNVNNKNVAVSKFSGKYKVVVKNNEDRINFLKQFNLNADPEPIETANITIPNTFNKVYENYNNLQTENGLDLTKYKGKTCTKYTYKITNYKNSKDEVHANIFIFENKVIAGDVCSVKLGGFMHGFSLPNKNKDNSKITYNINKVSAVNSRPNKKQKKYKKTKEIKKILDLHCSCIL